MADGYNHGDSNDQLQLLNTSSSTDVSPDVNDDVADDSLTAPSPRDSFKLVIIAMVVCGAGVLLPFNTFVAASDFLENRYSKYDPEFYIPFIYIWGTSLSVAFNTFFVMDRVSVYWRIRFGYILFLAGFVLFPVIESSVESSTLSREGGWGTLLSTVVLITIGSGIQQSSIYGFASILGSSYTMSVMFGESVAGVLVSFNRIVTKLAYDSSEESVTESTFVFVYITIGCIIGCVLVSEKVYRSSFVAFAFTRKYEGLAAEREQMRLNPNAPKVTVNRWEIAKQIQYSLASVFMSFLVTMSLFPGVVTIAPSERWGDWLPVVVIATFNVGDLVGKTLPFLGIKFLKFTAWSQWGLFLFAMSRLVFFPLLVLTATPKQHPIFGGEWPVTLLTFVFAISGGYTATIAMTLGSEMVSPDKKEVAGNVMTLALLCGLSIGATLSIALLYMI
eukprot:m.109889 g.109889  ORF g.109889 m.109889 type:complete len:446 (+) comp27996_c0_seq1:263-1600(+)